MKDLLNSKTKIIGLILAVLILLIMPPFYTSYWVTLLTQMLIFAILAMSLDILLGYTGLSSFGHAGFFGVAGYVVAILSTRYKMGFLFCFISGVSLSVLISLIFGFLVAHATGVYFLIITLALGMVLWGLAFRWVTMTGGDNGISGIVRPDIGLPIALKDPLTFYYFIFVFFLIALILMAILVRSPFGHSLKGSGRVNPGCGSSVIIPGFISIWPMSYRRHSPALQVSSGPISTASSAPLTWT